MGTEDTHYSKTYIYIYIYIYCSKDIHMGTEDTHYPKTYIYIYIYICVALAPGIFSFNQSSTGHSPVHNASKLQTIFANAVSNVFRPAATLLSTW